MPNALETKIGPLWQFGNDDWDLHIHEMIGRLDTKVVFIRFIVFITQ